MSCVVHSQVKSNSAALKSNNPKYKKSIYDLCKTIKNAKREFWIKQETQEELHSRLLVIAKL